MTRYWINRLFLVGLALSWPRAARADDLAFFYALDADFVALKQRASAVGQPLRVGSRNIAVFSFPAHKVYAVKMGSGAVETALSAQALLARVRCDAALSVGPVGALNDALATGSWHRVETVVSYQKGAWTKNGFEVSPAATARLPAHSATNLMLPELFRGAGAIKVASGEVFIASDRYRQELREASGADAVDMNLFGLAAACADHQVPLFCWRIVSDRANDNANEDFKTFVSGYDGAGGKAIAELVIKWPPNPNSPQSYPRIKKLLSDP